MGHSEGLTGERMTETRVDCCPQGGISTGAELVGSGWGHAISLVSEVWYMAKHLYESDARFLQSVAKHGGKDVTTTTIRRETEFSPEKTRYRFGKLEETGHILVSYAEQSAGPGDSPRTATLTDKGRQTLDTLTVEAKLEPMTPEEYGERLLELERQVRLLADAVDRLESFGTSR